MGAQRFSSIKAGMKKGTTPTKSTTRQSQMDAPPIEHCFTPSPEPAPPDGSELLDAMEAMKPLVASLGKEQIKRIVDLLG